MAYHYCFTQLIINKSVTEYIPVLSSVRQGCPASPLLFCIFLEPFCLKIINDSYVRGFVLHASEVKLLTYADDVAIFCTDEQSVSRAVIITKEFCDVTQSSVNLQKCAGFWHGNWESTPTVFERVNWTTTPGRYLGVPMESYSDSNQHWQDETQRLRDKSTKWGGRALSIFARATVRNLFFIAKVWFVMQAIHCSRVHVNKLHRIFAVFIWNSTWERTSRSSLFRRVKLGGLGLSHIYVRQIVNRFMFFRDSNDPFLRSFFQVALANALPQFIVSSCNEEWPTIRGYLKEVVDAVRFLSVRFSLDYLSNVSRKGLKRDLKEILFPVPLYRAVYSAG